ncbi:hypothetical protein BDQ17DRAFT_1167082, partial [Cyathus striatus]
EQANEDDNDGWVDEVAALSQADHRVIQEKLRPVKLILVKVCLFILMFSTTKLLPTWKNCLQELNLPVRIIPHDVCTQWNSTYDLLSFLLEYRR